MDHAWVMEIVHEPDQSHIPVQNVERIMRRVLDQAAKIERDAKNLVQECVSEFIGLVTDDAKLFMEAGARKTVTGPDVVLALEDLWFKPYADLVRLFQWPSSALTGDAPADASRKRKRRDRPPLPLDQQQQQFVGCQGLLKRWRVSAGGGDGGGGGGPVRAGQAGRDSSHEDEALGERFMRVLTINDLILPTLPPPPPPPHHHRVHTAAVITSSHTSSHSSLLIRTDSASSSSTHMSMAVDRNVIIPIGNVASPAALPDEDDTGFASCNVTTGASPIGDLNLILGRFVDVYDATVTAAATLIDPDGPEAESRPANEIKSGQDRAAAPPVLDPPGPLTPSAVMSSSPKPRTFPKSETLRTQHVAGVRRMDPFSVEMTNPFGMELMDAFNDNASMALNMAFTQFNDMTPAAGSSSNSGTC